jgi:hypothetical protein
MGQYVNAGGVRTYYGIYGEGESRSSCCTAGWLRPSPGPHRSRRWPKATAFTCPNDAATGAPPTLLDR